MLKLTIKRNGYRSVSMFFEDTPTPEQLAEAIKREKHMLNKMSLYNTFLGG